MSGVPSQAAAPSRPLRYLVVGALNTAVGYGLFALCYLALNGRWPYLAILVLAHVLAVTWSFTTHRRWVFAPTDPSAAHGLIATWLRYQLAYVGLLVFGIAVNVATLRWLVPSAWVAQGVATVAGVLAGWVVHRHLVFRTA